MHEKNDIEFFNFQQTCDWNSVAFSKQFMREIFQSVVFYKLVGELH